MEYLENILNEIDQNYNFHMNNLKKLFQIRNHLDQEQQNLLIKSINRFHKFFIYSTNRLYQLNYLETIKQENFTNEEIKMINQYIKKSSIGEDLINYFFSLPFQKIENEILSQNEVNFKTPFFQTNLQSQYFGYMKNNRPEGRGIKINDTSIQDGYFVDGQFVYGLDVYKFQERISQTFGYSFQDMYIQSWEDIKKSKLTHYQNLQGQFQATIQSIFSKDQQLLQLYNSKLHNLEQVINDNIYWYHNKESRIQFKNLLSYQGEVNIGTEIKQGFGLWYDPQSLIIVQAIWRNDSPYKGLIIYRTRDMNLISHVGDLDQFSKYIK